MTTIVSQAFGYSSGMETDDSTRQVTVADAEHDTSTVTERINTVCEEVDTADQFVDAAARRILANVEW